MKKQKLMVLLAFSCLLIVATIIGCTTVGEGFLIPVAQNAETKFAFVVNGSPDSDRDVMTLSVYTVNSSTGALTAAPGSPFGLTIGGSGTTFIDADPNSRFVYVPNGTNGTVSVFSVNQSTGALTAVAGSPFDVGGGEAFAVKADPSGRFLYVSNWDNGTVSAFSIGANGALTLVGTAQNVSGSPYQMMIDPQSRFLYVGVESEGNFVQGFAINSSTGALTPVPNTPFGSFCEPRSGTVDFTGHFLLIADRCDDTVTVFSIDQTTGALTEVGGSPFAAGSGAFHVVEVANGSQTFMAVNNLNDANISVFTFNTSTGALAAVSGSPFTFNNFDWPHFMAADPAGKFGYIVDFGNTITGVTISANGTVTQITGSPFTTGGVNNPTQIVLSH